MDFLRRYGPWAIVTGASSGLGEQFAHDLARRGLNLVLVARRLDRLDRLAADLRRESRIQTRVLALDLALADAPERLAEDAKDLDLGLVVNNAGFGWQGTFLEQEPAAIVQMLRLNCEAPALLARRLLPRLAARGHGGMVMVSSVAAYQGVPGMSLYGASKAFDLLLGEALAEELKTAGVDVITVSPGPTQSEFHAVAGVAKTGASRLARPEDVVKETLDRLGRSRSFVHGWPFKLLVFAQRFAPRGLAVTVTGVLIRRRAASAAERGP